MSRGGDPLLVFGPRSLDYDFGPAHPLTPRRFGPGIDLLRSVGAQPGLEPEPATDEELLRIHAARYVAAVRRLSADPLGPPEAGIGSGGDNPPFAGMHEAAASVAGGSIRAMERILRGDAEHAFHPGGGLHHAMRDRAAGFCIYDDPALGIAEARRRGLRVLYVDLDVHHGDGVQALFWDDPGVMTVSIHESGRYLFPGTGSVTETGEGEAAGTSVNLPLEPFSGDAAWLPAIETIVPELAAAFQPDVVVSQHGADSHAWDPLAHLRVTTTAMGAAARLVDRVAHRFAAGRWLATGGGGYDAYRVVPRTWSLVWLAGAHREAPAETSRDWRDRWAAEAARYGQAPLPSTFDDPPGTGIPSGPSQEVADAESSARAQSVRQVVVPALVRTAVDRGWWSPLDDAGSGPAAGSELVGAAAGSASAGGGSRSPTIVDLHTATLERLGLAGTLLHAALASGEAAATGAVADGRLVGHAVVGAARGGGGQLLDVRVEASHRRQGVAGRLLAGLTGTTPEPIDAVVTVAERDPIAPLPAVLRARVARRLLEAAGFSLVPTPVDIARIDPLAIAARRG